MLFDIILIGVLILCLITDLKHQKIYNKVIYPSLTVILLLHLTFSGVEGLLMSLAGFGMGLCILLIPYFLGGIGAGDVKLLALIGAAKGWIFVVNAALYMGMIGGFIALVIIIVNKETINFFKGIFIWIGSLLFGVVYKVEFPTTTLLMKYPYGVAIVGGSLICLFFKGAWIV